MENLNQKNANVENSDINETYKLNNLLNNLNYTINLDNEKMNDLEFVEYKSELDTLNLIYPIDKKNSFRILYDNQIKRFWRADDFDFERDLKDLENIQYEMLELLSIVLLFFKDADNIVIDNISENCRKHFSNNPLIMMNYNFQKMMEDIHVEVYHTTLGVFLKNKRFRNIVSKNKDKVKKIIKKIENIKTENIPLSDNILYFICIEGILFISSFLIIDLFKFSNKLNQLVNSNEMIFQDERLHTKLGIEIYKSLNEVDKTSKDRVIEIIDNIVSLEEELITEIFSDIKKDNIVLYNPEEIIMHVKYTADSILEDLGFIKYYNVPTPFPFSLNTKDGVNVNFFEKTNTNYRISNSIKQGEIDEIFQTLNA
jgi:ribonucleotide reductase beta subunit family protein with ferritin-like domain